MWKQKGFVVLLLTIILIYEKSILWNQIILVYEIIGLLTF
jgi:hypothetical protein